MAERLYISNKNETVRMFESDFMEFFSRVHPVIPLVLYLPVIGYMLYVSMWQRQLSIVAVTALFLLGVLLWTLTPAVFAGLVFGYVCYDMLHYATHHLAMKRGAWLWLKQYHLRHHFKDDHVGYGISSPLWDYVFRTTRK